MDGGRDPEKSSAGSLIEYSPGICFSDSSGCLPRSLPLAFAIANALAGSYPVAGRGSRAPFIGIARALRAEGPEIGPRRTASGPKNT